MQKMQFMRIIAPICKILTRDFADDLHRKCGSELERLVKFNNGQPSCMVSTIIHWRRHIFSCVLLYQQRPGIFSQVRSDSLRLCQARARCRLAPGCHLARQWVMTVTDSENRVIVPNTSFVQMPSDGPGPDAAGPGPWTSGCQWPRQSCQELQLDSLVV